MKVKIISKSSADPFRTLSPGFFASPVFEKIEGVSPDLLYPLAKEAFEAISDYEREFLTKVVNSRALYSGMEVAGIDLKNALSGSTTALILKAFEDKLKTEPTREKFLVSGVIYGLILAMKEIGLSVSEAEEAKVALLEELSKIESFLLQKQQEEKI